MFASPVFSAMLTSLAFNYHHQLIAVGTRIQNANAYNNSYNLNTFNQPPLPYNAGPSEYHAPAYNPRSTSEYNPYEGSKPPGYQAGGFEERDLGKDRSAFDSDDEGDLKAHGPKVNP